MSLTVSLVAVLIPLLFMGGVIGRLFREFAVTLAIAIVVSALLSLTLTAMMCAHILKPARRRTQGRVARAFERGFDVDGRGFYDRALGWVLRPPAPDAGWSTIATVVLTVVLGDRDPEGLLPAAGHRAAARASPRRRPTSRSRA